MKIVRFHAGGFELGAAAAMISSVDDAQEGAIHICKLLGLPAQKTATRTLTLASRGQSFRLAVDAPLRFSNLSSEAIVPASETLRRHVLASYVVGFAELGDHFITLVSASAIAERARLACNASNDER